MSPGATSHSSQTAQTMSVAPKMTSTSPGSVAPATIWSHSASMVPTGDHGVGVRERAGGLAHRHDHRHLRLRDPEGGRAGRRSSARGCASEPSAAVTPGVDGRQARERVGRHGLAGPVAAGVGALVEAQRKNPSASGMLPAGRTASEPAVGGGPPGPRRAARGGAARPGCRPRSATGPWRRRPPRRAGGPSPSSCAVTCCERLAGPGAPGPLGVVAQDVGLGRHARGGAPCCGRRPSRPRRPPAPSPTSSRRRRPRSRPAPADSRI